MMDPDRIRWIEARKDVTNRHPGGRTCRGVLPLVILLLPYIATRAAWDVWKDKRKSISGKRKSGR